MDHHHFSFASHGRPASPLVISPDLDALLEADAKRRGVRPESPAAMFVMTRKPSTAYMALPPPPRPRKGRSGVPVVAGGGGGMGRMGGGRLPASRTGPVHTSSDSQSSADSLDPFLNPAPVLDGILNPGITTTPATARRLSLSPPPQRRPTARQIQDAKKINDSTAAAAEEEEDMNRFARGLPTLVVPTLLGDTKDQKSRRRTGSVNSRISANNVNDPGPQTRASTESETLEGIAAPARISVSSTRYASTEAHGLGDSDDTRSIRFPDRDSPEFSPRAESFIDLSSTSPPAYTYTRTHAHPDRGTSTSNSLHSPPSSPVAETANTSHSPVTFFKPLPPVHISTEPINLFNSPMSSPVISSPPSATPTARPTTGSRPLPKIPNVVPEPSSAMDTLPPTRNVLSDRARSGLIKKTQKLTQVFGTTPSADALAPTPPKKASNSASNHLSVRPPSPPRAQWPPAEDTTYISAAGRRHSTSPTLEDFSFLSEDEGGDGESVPTTPLTGAASSFAHSSGGGTIEVGSNEGTIESVPGADLEELEQDHPGAQLARLRDRMGRSNVPESPASFMEFSDDEPDAPRSRRNRHRGPPPSHSPSPSSEDAQSMLSVDSTHTGSGRRKLRKPAPTARRQRPTSLLSFTSGISPSLASASGLGMAHSNGSGLDTASLGLDTASLDPVDEDRRRKRDKLAKLHRFLGSRVPVDLVIGPTSPPTSGLPPIVAIPEQQEAAMGGQADSPVLGQEEEGSRKLWQRQRRRRSSSAAFPTRWSDDNRTQETLDEREKAVVVRRAQKMERMFGVAPPQGLFHSRAVSPSVSPTAVRHRPAASTSSPTAWRSFSRPTSPLLPEQNSPSYFHNAAYKLKGKRKSRRPGTGGTAGTIDSRTDLLTGEDENEGDDAGTLGTASLGTTQNQQGMSDVYMYYRNSLNSLRDIIDRDDKQSLAELHEYLKSDAEPSTVLDYATAMYGPGGASGSGPKYSAGLHIDVVNSPIDLTPPGTSGLLSPSTPRAERRHSLPVRTSMASLRSEYSEYSTYEPSISPSIAPPSPDPQAFAQRRRRAAKLAAFFGASYKDIVGEVLESILTGVQDDTGAGRLNDAEMRDLLMNVETIRHKQDVMA